MQLIAAKGFGGMEGGEMMLFMTNPRWFPGIANKGDLKFEGYFQMTPSSLPMVQNSVMTLSR